MELIENAINREDIKSYDYTEFSALEKIGAGGYGVVYKSEWKNRGLTIALKKLKNIPLNEEEAIQKFVKELKHLQKVYKHQNVVEFYGVTRDVSSEFYMKSDIYSFGVILWEISSGRPPFDKFSERNQVLAIHILQGKREEAVEGTPNQYIQLYKRCWDHNPDQRPTIKEISDNISAISKILDFSVNSNYVNVSIDDIAENINVNQHYEDNQNELNGDNLGNQDESESIPHPRDYRAMNLNEFGEIDTNNNIAVIMNNDSEETIQIQIETIADLWNFFIKYFLKPGLLRVFQSRSRDVMGVMGGRGRIWLHNSPKMDLMSVKWILRNLLCQQIR
ncbi:kinase-like protein [Gigaspora margarita]|uniref:Kinase-like protein n=1 Tax=Gigaspora margarita TaxID=4874 RepID=A0A8H3X3B7_GIGMA|nr:kinase-like protein [Gigaspora margarita]